MKKALLMTTAALAGALALAETSCDVVIYGSSPAALTAAIEAQNHGKSAVIVCPETRIGGLTTGGLGQTDIGNKSAFGGLALQFYRDVADYYKNPANWKYEKRSDYVPDGQCAGSLGEDSMWTFEPHAALEILEGWEKKHNLRIVRGEFLDRGKGGVAVEGGRIVSFRTLSGKVFAGKAFVDATYEGDLMAAAGVSYTVGREPNARYGETISGIEKRASKNHQFNPGVDPYVVKGDPKSGLLPWVEPYNPDEKDGDGDRRVQAYCFRMCLTDDPSNRIPFAKPAGYDPLNYELLLRNLEAIDQKTFVEKADRFWEFMPWINSRMPNRKTDTNNRSGFSTDFIGQNWAWPEASYAERAKILKAHLDYQMGLMWTLANDPRVPAPIRDRVAQWGTCKDEFADGLGGGWQTQLYVREARRLVGDVVMTEHHCRGDRKVSRPVAMGAYGMDSHHVRRYVGADGFVHNEGNIEDYNRYSPFGPNAALNPKGYHVGFKPYSIDYGAIIPKKAECTNLYVPVCLSASHMAFGSIRMEPVFFALGQVAGAAASLAIDGGCAAQDLDYAKLRAALLAGGQVVEGKPDAETVVLEAEAFEDWGGWVNDTQFMDQMGSPYLLAHGLGKPVDDARTTFTVRSGGVYDVWVRTKNWLAWVKAQQGAEATGEVPGAFTLRVDGKELPAVLGVEGKGEWLWTKAGSVDLAKDVWHSVELHDRDGFDGRCDAVVFTQGGKPAWGSARANLSLNGIANPDAAYDVVVVGGGIAGICSAISSARLGLKTALVHDRPVLGGNNSSEVRVHLGARQNIAPYPRLGDVLAEFGPRRGGNAEPAGTYEDDRKLKAVLAEKNLSLFLNMHVDAVSKLDARIAAVGARNTRTGETTRFMAKWFVDCTGDGTVGYLAGADWRQGRESRAETGERRAPETADTKTMGASVQWRAVKGAGKSAFPLRPWMIRFDEGSGRAEMKGDWDWEAGIGRDQIAEAEYIRDYGLLVAFSNWAFAKNTSAKKDAFADKELEWVAYVAGRRESRRLLGDFILDEEQIVARKWEDDATCACTWSIDLHLPKTVAETKFAGEPFRSNAHHKLIHPYPIPYRCLYSRNVPNLFMAGRNVSVTHNALGTARLMRTHGMMGEVVGMAASLCKRYGCDPRGVYTDHLPELKALMEKGIGDGKAYPPQLYNQGGTLDPELRKPDAGNFQIKP